MNKSILKFFKLILFLFLLMLLFPPIAYSENNQTQVITVTVDDTVTAGTAQQVSRAIQVAEAQEAEAVVILLNTPGGLVNATLEMLEDITNTDIPIITYVTPQGAIAASAGTFILISGDIAAMSPGTTCGAAMPVTMGGATESTQAADEKTINLLAEHVRGIAEEKGRPGDIAEKFVTENLSLTYNRALEEGIIEVVANNLPELLEIVDGREVTTQAGIITLNTAGAEIIALEKNAVEQITHLVSNPQIAVILMMVGIYGLIIGFNSPGFFVPEVLGGISLLLGLYGLGLFEVNLLAGLLILLGLVLLIAEAFTPAYGILGIGGVVSIVLGIVFLPMEPMMPNEWFGTFRVLAVSIGLISALFVFLILTNIVRLRKKNVVHGKKEFSFDEAVVIEELNPKGLIKVQGEIWRATSSDGSTISEGVSVKAVDRQGMLVVVEPLSNKEE
ncbi:hypothetical protein SYNTR_1552 [Candidatus Syntrophocurvum alkaliphilum]|uniref:Uncharacterized protein n=1 Tax=Candidatus Syntrophocurvum alkaliphilum TaxID=2293317 RepID=A0A6I6DC02_9FIRM|nr:nodulation protein NfeD [Candidatus Syntrophocurvum alkaliphilum]QGU00146.1 hypothetical protein SYNTR_1552 [Candidatus Syntrophocurvum alkaliphilum]